MAQQTDTTLFQAIAPPGTPSYPQSPEIRRYLFVYSVAGQPGVPAIFKGNNVTVSVPNIVGDFYAGYVQLYIAGLKVAQVTRVRGQIDSPVIQPAPGYSCRVIRVDNVTQMIELIDTASSSTYTFVGHPNILGLDQGEPVVIGDSTASVTITRISTGGQAVQSSNPDDTPIPSSSSNSLSKPILSLCGRNKLLSLSKSFSPRIDISCLSAARNTNFGEMFMTIFDIQPFPGTYDGQSVEVSSGVWQSQFCKFPQFNHVMRGTGVNLQQKFLSLIDAGETQESLESFTGNMALYTYARYGLSRFMWGDFSTCHLVRSLERKFLKDLKNSRYWEFYPLFTEESFGLTEFGSYFRRKCRCRQKCL